MSKSLFIINSLSCSIFLNIYETLINSISVQTIKLLKLHYFYQFVIKCSNLLYLHVFLKMFLKIRICNKFVLNFFDQTFEIVTVLFSKQIFDKMFEIVIFFPQKSMIKNSRMKRSKLQSTFPKKY